MAPVRGYFTKNSLQVPHKEQRLEEWWLELRKKEWEAFGVTDIRNFYNLTEHTSTQLSFRMLNPTWRLLHETLQYFRLPDDITRIVPYLKPTRSNLTALPPEIQLMILERLSLSEMDTSIRNHFPHLINLWLPIAPLRVMQWFTHLCSPKNLRDAGSIRKSWGGICRVYRFENLDHHPGLNFTELYNIDENEKQKAVPSCRILMGHLESLYWMWRAGRTRHDRRWSCYCPPNPSPQILCNLAATSSSRTPTIESKRGHPMLLPLYSSSTRTHLPSSTYHPCIFIYTSELEFIFNELEVVFRPVAYLRPHWSNRGPFTKSDNNHAPRFVEKWFDLGDDIAERISRREQLVRRGEGEMTSWMAGLLSLVLLCFMGACFVYILCYIPYTGGIQVQGGRAYWMVG